MERDRLGDLAVAVRRAVAARTSDADLIEDVTQETLVRAASAPARFDDNALRAYAIVTARHLLVDHARALARHGRHQHRLVEYGTLDGPEEATLLREETEALAAALGRLPADDRALLVDHEAQGVNLSELARRHGTSRGAIGVRLARVRAVMRVEFLLAFRRVELPTSRCRPVLVALSAGDVRRQQALGAGDHLLSCPTCAALSEPIVERQRSIAGWAWLAASAGALRALLGRMLRHRPVHVAAGTATVVVAAFAVTAYLHGGAGHNAVPPAPVTSTTGAPTTRAPTTVRPPTPTPTGSLSVGGSPLPLHPELTRLEGRVVSGTDLHVVSVPTASGFWVSADNAPLWIQLTDAIGKPAGTFTVGQTVDVTGTVRRLAGSAERLGLSDSDGASLRAAGAYLETTHDAVVIHGKGPASRAVNG
jgi:RNA polymerase sigma factor (sigma-70 family)